METPEKLGSGFLFYCGDSLLLLQRSSLCGNPGTWGLPGGNADSDDTSLVKTAEREAIEEIGGLPKYTLKLQVKTMRGSQKQKHYYVFIAEVSPEDRDSFHIVLNEEHDAYRWVPVDEALKLPLHPVVQRLLLTENKEQVKQVIPSL